MKAKTTKQKAKDRQKKVIADAYALGKTEGYSQGKHDGITQTNSEICNNTDYIKAKTQLVSVVGQAINALALCLDSTPNRI